MLKHFSTIIANLAFVCFGGLAAAQSPSTYYVDPAGDDTGSGTVLDPLKTIGEALSRTAASDTILLADGVYEGDGNRDLVLPVHPLIVHSTSGSAPDCVIDCGGTETESHLGFIVDAGQDTTSVIAGITIRNGWGDISSISIDATSNLKLEDCDFVDGHGAAIFCDGSFDGPFREVGPVIRRCRFENNTGGGFRGGPYVSPWIADCEFIGNSATRGGAVFMGAFSRGTIERTLFERNTATWSAGALDLDLEQYATIADCVFRDNSAPRGGAVGNPLGWFKNAAGNKSLGDFTNCVFERNTADEGGAVYTRNGGDLHFVDCTFVENTATTTGGVLTEIEWNHNSFVNCLFVRNGAPSGGAIYVGDAVSFSGSTVRSCTFVGNSGTVGSTIAMVDCADPDGLYSAALVVENTIIAYGVDGAAVAVVNGSGPHIGCSDLRENDGGDWVDWIADQVDMRGNFSADPCFCDMANDDYHLSADSWCLPGNHPWGCNGLVGAFGEGCGANGCNGLVPTLVSRFRAEVLPGRVMLTWRAGTGSEAWRFKLEGKGHGRQWRVSLQTDDRGQYTAIDESAELHNGTDFEYTLFIGGASTDWSVVWTENVSIRSLPRRTRITDVFPNPFNPATTVKFELAKAATVSLRVYDLAGRSVRTLGNCEPLNPGSHLVRWDGCGDDGYGVSAGVYFVRLDTSMSCDVKRVVLVK